jgi:DtxR family transcriptional regulator, Mn-dependent transcriptional regulator
MAVRAIPDLSGPVEDYLKAIYDLERHGEPAGTNEIAAALGIAAPSVSGMLRRLVEQGLVTHERYRGVRLTESGRLAALRTIRRHRIIETYLEQVLGYPWDQVHDEAERLEHAASDALVDRMAAALGDPTHDPHGAPIPSRDGQVDERWFASLAELPAGTVATVAMVGGRDADRLRYLAELGITPGTQVQVVSRAPFDGPMTVRVGSGECVIGAPLAASVMITPPAA